MIDHQQSPNWVADRGRCNLDLTFEALCQVFERDVGEMNKLSPQTRRWYKFTLEKKGEGTAPMLQAEGNPRDGKIDKVTFTKSITAIAVNHLDMHGYSDVLVFPKWNEKTHACKLCVGSEPLKVWEVSQEALGSLFFG